jgi:hypothetical protein
MWRLAWIVAMFVIGMFTGGFGVSAFRRRMPAGPVVLVLMFLAGILWACLTDTDGLFLGIVSFGGIGLGAYWMHKSEYI